MTIVLITMKILHVKHGNVQRIYNNINNRSNLNVLNIKSDIKYYTLNKYNYALENQPSKSKAQILPFFIFNVI